MTEPVQGTTSHLRLRPEHLGWLRRTTRAALAMWDQRHAEDAALMCLSELLGNVLRHCGPDPWVTVLTRPIPGGLRVEVHDGDPRLPGAYTHPTPPTGARPDPGLDEDGRGILVIAAYADRFGYQPALGGKYGWFEIDRPTG